MSAISADRPALSRPELTKAIEDIAAKARKQFDETGDLAGFSSEYTTESGDGKITLSISAVATALYDKSAGKDDFVLQYRLGSENAQGSGSGGGSTQTIKNDADIDSFARNLIATTTQRTFNQGYGGDQDVVKALIGSLQPAKGQPDAPATTDDDTPDGLDALRRQQEATAGLVSALEDFVTGLKDMYQPQKTYQATDLPDAKDAAGQGVVKAMQILLDIRV